MRATISKACILKQGEYVLYDGEVCKVLSVEDSAILQDQVHVKLYDPRRGQPHGIHMRMSHHVAVIKTVDAEAYVSRWSDDC